MDKLKVGTRVIFRDAYGNGLPQEANIASIQQSQDDIEGRGKVLGELLFELKNSGVFCMDNGSWCYGYQIDSIVN